MDLQPQHLSSFASIHLNEMDEVALMNRSDTKYIFHVSQLAQVLQQLQLHYRILEVEGNRSSRYESLYFDYPDFLLYHQHRRGRLPRYKVRIRNYLENARSFLEVKAKSNKGKTQKSRLESMDSDKLSIESIRYLTGFSLPEPGNLMPMVNIRYQRITLVNIESKERVTIDTQLAFAGNESQMTMPQLVIAEVKQDRSKRSFFAGVMQQMQIREGSASKYCMAVASLHREIPHHHLKPKLRAIRKIAYGTFADIA